MGGLRRRIPLTHTGVLRAACSRSRASRRSRASSRRTRSSRPAYASHVPGPRDRSTRSGCSPRGSPRSTCGGSTSSCSAARRARAKDVLEHVHEPAPVGHATRWSCSRCCRSSAGCSGFPQIYGDWFGIADSHSLANFLRRCWPRAEPHHDRARDRARADAARGRRSRLLGFAGRASPLPRASPSCPRGSPARARAACYALLANKYYVDELYDAVIVRPLVRVSDAVLFRAIDAGADRRRGGERPRARGAACSRRAGCAGSSRASRRATSRRCSPAPRRSSGTC